MLLSTPGQSWADKAGRLGEVAVLDDVDPGAAGNRDLIDPRGLRAELDHRRIGRVGVAGAAGRMREGDLALQVRLTSAEAPSAGSASPLPSAGSVPPKWVCTADSGHLPASHPVLAAEAGPDARPVSARLSNEATA